MIRTTCRDKHKTLFVSSLACSSVDCGSREPHIDTNKITHIYGECKVSQIHWQQKNEAEIYCFKQNEMEGGGGQDGKWYTMSLLQDSGFITWIRVIRTFLVFGINWTSVTSCTFKNPVPFNDQQKPGQQMCISVRKTCTSGPRKVLFVSKKAYGTYLLK